MSKGGSGGFYPLLSGAAEIFQSQPMDTGGPENSVSQGSLCGGHFGRMGGLQSLLQPKYVWGESGRAGGWGVVVVRRGD